MTDPIIASDVPLPADTAKSAKAKPVAKETSDYVKETVVVNTPPKEIFPTWRKSNIPELYRFVRGLSAETPYHELADAAISAGWIWRMVEESCEVVPGGFAKVTFNVYIGKATNDFDLELFDAITMMVPQEAPSPSLIARLNAQVALTYMVFGRLPPQPVAPPQPVPVAPEPAPEPVNEMPAWSKPEQGVVSLRATTTPDGIPMLENLYEKSGSPEAIVAAALDRFQSALEDIDDSTLLNVLWVKNEGAVEFIKDFGSASDKVELSNMFRQRAEQLNGANRRRA